MFSLVIYFIHSISRVYKSISTSQFFTPWPFPPWEPGNCSLCLCLCSPIRSSICFSRFHRYALMYSICFSLSDSFHSVWHSLGPSTSLQMTQFCCFLWLTNIFSHICSASSSPIPLLMDHNSKRYVSPSVHSSTVYNSQDLDTTQVSLLVLKVDTHRLGQGWLKGIPRRTSSHRVVSWVSLWSGS